MPLSDRDESLCMQTAAAQGLLAVRYTAVSCHVGLLGQQRV